MRCCVRGFRFETMRPPPALSDRAWAELETAAGNSWSEYTPRRVEEDCEVRRRMATGKGRRDVIETRQRQGSATNPPSSFATPCATLDPTEQTLRWTRRPGEPRECLVRVLS